MILAGFPLKHSASKSERAGAIRRCWQGAGRQAGLRRAHLRQGRAGVHSLVLPSPGVGLLEELPQQPWKHHPEQPKAQAVLQLHSPGNSPGTASASSPSRPVGWDCQGEVSESAEVWHFPGASLSVLACGIVAAATRCAGEVRASTNCPPGALLAWKLSGKELVPAGSRAVGTPGTFGTSGSRGRIFTCPSEKPGSVHGHSGCF